MVRKYFTGVANAYCLVHFACCREIKKMSDLELEQIKKEFEEKIEKQRQKVIAKKHEETKDVSENRANTTATINVGNFTLIYGC
jgi:hypothetical protein